MLNPLMLLGLLGLSAPILIHLINRRRMRPRPLATLRFLDQQNVANAFAPVPRDVLQLMLRLLLLLLFVLLMVRMTAPSERASDRAVVLVIDNSLSMQRKAPTGASLFDTARRQARALIDGLRESDKASVLLVGDRVFSDSGLIRDQRLLRTAVENAWVSAAGSRSLIPAIREAVSQLQNEPAPDRLVVVFSSLQREMLSDAGEDPDLRKQLATGAVRLVLIGEPLPKADNLALEQAVCRPSAIHVGGGGKVTARVRNHAERESVFNIGLKVGENEGETRELKLAPGASAHIDLAHRFLNYTDVALTTAVSSRDPLTPDDAYYVPMRLRARREILMVTAAKYQVGKDVARGYSGADVLKYAINPEAELGLRTGDHTKIRAITPATFAAETLSSYEALIFYGVDALPETRSLEDLKNYLENGGGVWLIPDRDVIPRAFNETFGALLGGAKLGALREPKEAVFVSRSESALTTPLLRPFVRAEWANPDEIPISRYWSLQGLGHAHRAMATREGDVLAAISEVGHGHTFLQLMDCDIRSSELPRSTAFLPLVQTVLSHLTGGDEMPIPDLMRAGATHHFQLPPAYREIGGEVVVQGPSTYRFPVDPTGNVRIGGIYIAGRYTVTHPGMPGRTWILTVNPVTGQSDLTPSEPSDIARVFGETQVSRIPFEALEGRYTFRFEISTWMLALVFAALAVEALSAAWSSRRRKEKTA